MTRLKELVEQIHRAQAEKEKAIQLFQQLFPVGGTVHWWRNGHRQTGIVLGHGYDMRTQVLNLNTEREVWLTGNWLIEGAAAPRDPEGAHP